MTNEEMAIKIQAGELDLLNTLWEKNTGLFHNHAYTLYEQYYSRCLACGVEIDGIFQLSYFALCDAVKAFTPETGYKLTTYMRFPLKNHFNALLGIRGKTNPLNDSTSLNKHIGEGEDTELQNFLVDSTRVEVSESVIDKVFHDQLHSALERGISKLSVNQQQAIRKRYFEGKVQKDIAVEMKTTPKHIHVWQRDGLYKLRRNTELMRLRDELIGAQAYRGTGLRTFKETHMSSVERVVMQLDGISSRTRAQEH